MEVTIGQSRLGNYLRVIAAICALLALQGFGQDPVEPSFDELSLKFRTALHYDPLLESALDSLVALYRDSDRVDELIGLYRSHIEQYSDDAGAKSALIRLLGQLNRSGVDELIASAVPLHPEYAPLQYLLFQFLQKKGDSRALESLSRAIDLETNASRRSQWLEELLQFSDQEDARVLGEAQLNRILIGENLSGEFLMSLARLMQRFQFWELSLEALGRAQKAGLGAEGELEIAVQTALAQAELGRREEGSRTLDELLMRMAPDHWRRREIMSMRIAVLASDEERNTMLENLEKAYQESPESETAILDYVDLLIASERLSDASKLLVRSAAAIPGSELIETRTVELLNSTNDNKGFEQFLKDRLEVSPDRADLRFQLVKVHYSLGNDAGAEQDFQAVVAGLTPDGVSERILELQRYLRGIGRADAAAPYLERYLETHPERLDVARELSELYLKDDDRLSVEGLVEKLDPAGADVENAIDLSEFLLSGGLYGAASQILRGKLAVDPEDFDLNLLMIEAFGELGDQSSAASQISLIREKADTPARYSQWLSSAIKASERLEVLPRFLETEQNRFSFSNDSWPADKVEKFIILCEAGDQKLSTDRVALALGERLEDGALDPKLKIRLQRFLVGLLENDPASSAEVDLQFQELASNDPARASEYDLRRALVYHRSQRIDLSQELIAAVDLGQIENPNLIRGAVEALLEYQFLSEAESALAQLNRLEPDDVFSWSRRLSLLASMERESEFRSVARTLRSGASGVKLLPESFTELTDHLVASYWRSVSRLISSGGPSQFEEVLPILAAVDREIQSPKHQAWTEWTRAVILLKVGRPDESREALNRFHKNIADHEMETVIFPDGLSLSANSAESSVSFEVESSEVDSHGAEFLLDDPGLRWAFEVDSGSYLIDFARGVDRILALDNRGQVYGIRVEDGRLIWRKSLGTGRAGDRGVRPELFEGSPVGKVSSEVVSPIDQSRLALRLSLDGNRFMHLSGDELKCFNCNDAAMVWSASLPFGRDAERESVAQSGNSFPIGDYLVVGNGKAVVFRPATQEAAGFDSASGKLMWVQQGDFESGPVPGGLRSLNSGACISGGRVLLYGRETTVLDADSGDVVWRFEPNEFTTFPIHLRKDRGGKEELAMVTSNGVSAAPRWQGKSEAEDSRLKVLDFFTSQETMVSTLFENSSSEGTFVSPGIHWSYSRLTKGEPAMGLISGPNLWFAEGELIRRISAQIPIGSAQLPASGVFLGENGNHAWFLDKGSLYHADFYRRKGSFLDISDIGALPTIRSVMVGNQLVIKGANGLKIVNALTGQVVGQAAWPVQVQEYLHLLAGSDEKKPDVVYPLWQGNIVTGGVTASPVCRSIEDFLGDGEYFSSFGNRVLICLEKQPLGGGEASKN